MNKILVTGAAGLIGSSITKKLQTQGYEIIPCDIRFLDNRLSFFSDEVLPLLMQCIGVVHLAALSRVIHAEIYPDLCQEINVEGNAKFLEMCKSLPRKPWVIYGSSREVYGEQKTLPVTEDTYLDPINNYARSKVLVENLVTDLEKFDFNIAVLRFSNVYGGLLDHYNRVVPAFCINALKEDPIRIDGKDCVFDFTYIDDVVEGISLTVDYLQKTKTSLPPIHFTSCRPHNLEALANKILGLTGSKSAIEFCPPRNFDVGHFYGDYDRARTLLGWQPKFSLEEGLKRFIQDIKNTPKQCPYNIDMVIYENIESYSWLPALL